jgi:hypothetical protein
MIVIKNIKAVLPLSQANATFYYLVLRPSIVFITAFDTVVGSSRTLLLVA